MKKTCSQLNQQVGGNHYKSYKVQPLEFTILNDIPFAEGCVIKYVCRHKNKNGVEDLNKAIHILKYLKEVYYGENPNS